MKKLFTFLTLLTLALTIAWAGEKTVVFQPGVDMGASYVINDGIKIQMFGMNNPSYYEQAPGGTGGANTFTVVTYNHLIKSIEFTCIGSGTQEYGPGLITSFSNHTYSTGNNVGSYTYSGHNGKWSNGLTQSITFTVATGRIVRFGEIKVTYFKDNGDIYDLVTTLDDIVTDGKYVLVSQNYSRSMSSLGSLNASDEITPYDKQAESVEWLNPELTKVRVNDETQVITLKGVSSGGSGKKQAYFSIIDDHQYLRNTNNEIVNIESQPNLPFYISLGTNSNALISTSSNHNGSAYYMRYQWNPNNTSEESTLARNRKFTFLQWTYTNSRVWLYKQAQNYNVNFVATPTGSGTANYTNGVVEINGHNTSQQYETVKFTLSPNSGYRAKENGVTIVDADNNAVSFTEDNGVFTFIMPGKDVTITAEFEVWQPHSISTVCAPTSSGYFDNFKCNGNSTNISQGAQYYRGDEITFKVKTNWGNRIVDVKMSYVDDNNETIEQILTPTLTEGDGNTYSVAMPDYDMTLTATFRVAEYDLFLLGTHNGNQVWHSYGPKFNYDPDTQTYWIDVYYKGVNTDYGQGTSAGGDKYGFFSITKEVKGNATDGDNWSISGRYGSSNGDNYKILGDYGSSNTTATGGLTGGQNAFMIPAGIYRIEVTKDNNDQPSQVTVTRTDVSLAFDPAGGDTETNAVQVSWGTDVAMESDIQTKVHDIAYAYATAYPQYIPNGFTEADMSLSYNIAETTDLDNIKQNGTPTYVDPEFKLVDYDIADEGFVTVKVDGDAWIGWIHAATNGYYKVIKTPLHWIEHPDKGVVGNKYIVSDRLMGVFAKDNILWAKDVDFDSNNANTMPTAGEGEQVFDYMRNFIDFFSSENSTSNVPSGMQTNLDANAPWEQKNWVQLDFSQIENGDILAKQLENKYLTAGTVKGEYVDNNNYRIVLSSEPTPVSIQESGVLNYQPNFYCPINFMTFQGVPTADGYNAANDVSTFASNGNNPNRKYYFLNPKIQEYALITFAVWDSANEQFVIAESDGVNINAANLNGAFKVDWEYNNWNDPEGAAADQRNNLDAADPGQNYIFHAIVQRPVAPQTANGAPARVGKAGQTPTGNYIVYPLDLKVSNDNIVTGVNQVSTGKAVYSVTYCDLMGHMSSKPLPGVNIVITLYTDGTTKTSKKVF